MKRLKEIREARKLSQSDVCKALGIKQSRLSNYETGYRKPNIETVATFCRLYSCTADYLIGISDIPENAESMQRVLIAKLEKLQGLIQELSK